MTRFRGLDARIPAALLDRMRCGCAVAVALLACLGCKSDLSQQLLERELRMQEDQIYQLQDELQDASARLSRAAGENTSLKKQLGFSENDSPAAVRGPSMPSMLPKPSLSPPLLAPPKIDMPAASPQGPGAIAPPKLEGIPPLPAEPRFPGAAAPGSSSITPASNTAVAAGDPTVAAPSPLAIDSGAQPIVPWSDPAANPPTGRRLSHEESLADAGRITHLIVNPARTACFDGDGDGVSDGLAVVIEPRDGDERLVTAAGDVSITVYDHGGPAGAAPVARWDIPDREAISHFRRTSRNRGLHFVLRWPGLPPQGDHIRVQVALTTFEAAAFQADCTVAAKPQRTPDEAP